MIKINNLTKKYGKNVALSDINLEINEGTSIAFVGANGSGKTTLIEMIAGVLEPTYGDILIDDIPAIKQKCVGIQFQEGVWPKGITPKMIINFYKGKEYIKHEGKVLIEVFEIQEFINRSLNNLSGGQKQRFNALLAVINNPKVLILDELITGLDLKMQIKLINFFNKKKINEQKIMIVVSHMPEEIELLCDRVVLLEKGEIVMDKELVEIKEKFKSLRNMMIEYYEGNL